MNIVEYCPTTGPSFSIMQGEEMAARTLSESGLCKENEKKNGGRRRSSVSLAKARQVKRRNKPTRDVHSGEAFKKI